MNKITKAVTGTAAALAFLMAATAPAHAISEAYRKQLEREHKTQVQDANSHPATAAPAPARIKPVHAKKFGVDFKRGADGIGYADGVACATDEKTAQATAYSCGVYTVIVRANLHADLMKNGQYVGRMNY